MAPIGNDGKAIELHHLLQTEDGGLIELTQTKHRLAPGAYKFWHDTSSGFRSAVDHGKEWAKFKNAYWPWRASQNFFIHDLIVNSLTGITDIDITRKGFSLKELMLR